MIDFHWSLSENKSPQISRTLLSILTDRNNAVVCIVSAFPIIFKSFSPFIIPFRIIPSAWISICPPPSCSVFCSFKGRSRYLSRYFLGFLLFFYVNFTLWNTKTVRLTIQQVLIFMTITRSGRLDEIRGRAWISKS